MKKYFTWFTTVTILTLTIWTVLPSVAGAALVTCGNVATGSSANGCTLGDLFETAIRLVQYLLSGAAVIAVGGVVYGGAVMITSAGNESKTTAGKKAVTNSLIGLAIILLAFLLVRTLFTVLGFDKGDEVLEQPGQYLNDKSGGLINPGSTTAP